MRRSFALLVFLLAASPACARCGNLAVLDTNFSLSVQQPGTASAEVRVFVEEWQSYIPPPGCNFTASAEFNHPPGGIAVTVAPVPSRECPALHCLDVYCPPGAGGERGSSCFIAQGQGAANITFAVNATAENASAGNYSGQIVWRDSSSDTLGRSSAANFTLALSAPAKPAPTATPKPTAAPTATPKATAAPTPTSLIPSLPLRPPAAPTLTVEEILIALAAGAVFLFVMWFQARKGPEEY